MGDEAKDPEPVDRVSDDEVSRVDSVGEIVMPDVNKNAVAAAAPAEPSSSSAPPPPSDGPRDKYGRTFDPTVHEHIGGVPTLSPRNGTLKIRRGGDMRSKVAMPRGAAPQGGEAAAAAAPTSSPPPSSSEPPPQPVDYRKVAETWVNPALDSVTAAIGEEWDFDPSERERFIGAASRLAARWDVKTEMHPLAELVALSVAAVKVRSEKPKTKAMLEKARATVSSWWDAIWAKVTGRRAAAAPPQRPPDEQPSATSAAAADAKSVEFRIVESRGGSPRVDPQTGEPIAR